MLLTIHIQASEFNQMHYLNTVHHLGQILTGFDKVEHSEKMSLNKSQIKTLKTLKRNLCNSQKTYNRDNKATQIMLV
jgi:hypothetical protein